MLDIGGDDRRADHPHRRRPAAGRDRGQPRRRRADRCPPGREPEHTHADGHHARARTRRGRTSRCANGVAPAGSGTPRSTPGCARATTPSGGRRRGRATSVERAGRRGRGARLALSGLHRTVARTRFVARWCDRRPLDVVPSWPPGRRDRSCWSCVAAVRGAVDAAVGRHTVALPPTPPSPVAVGSSAGTTPSGAAADADPRRGADHLHAARSAAGGRARPARLCIPALRVDTTVMELGLNSDRTVEVPPLSQVGRRRLVQVLRRARRGRADGDPRPRRLGDLRRRRVLPARHDCGPARPSCWPAATARSRPFGSTVSSEVSKKHFPTDDVYGPTSGPAIRLVTCGGRFDSVDRQLRRQHHRVRDAAQPALNPLRRRGPSTARAASRSRAVDRGAGAGDVGTQDAVVESARPTAATPRCRCRRTS